MEDKNMNVSKAFQEVFGRKPNYKDVEPISNALVEYLEIKNSLEIAIQSALESTGNTDISEEKLKEFFSVYQSSQRHNHIPINNDLLSDLEEACENYKESEYSEPVFSILKQYGFEKKKWYLKKTHPKTTTYIFTDGINNSELSEGTYVFEIKNKHVEDFEKQIYNSVYKAWKNFAYYGTSLSFSGGALGFMVGVIYWSILDDHSMRPLWLSTVIGTGAGIALTTIIDRIESHTNKKAIDRLIDNYITSEDLIDKSSNPYDIEVIKHALE